jgi:glyoxylase-like metal-dependent hydrolase (beta-lactamase superfamily II)
MREVSDGIFAIDGLKMGRSYFIEDARGLALIDTSSPSAGARILDAITAIRRRPEDLRLIVATHYHYDHTGNVAMLIERTGARFVAHEADAPYIDGRKPWGTISIGPLEQSVPESRTYTLTLDAELRAGDALDIAGGLEVLHTPGHTPGSISLYSRARGVLFTGDAIGNCLGLRLPSPMATHDAEEAKRSVRRLAELDYEIALPGHGQPIVSRASEKIAEWAKRWL